jgi:hypothetical protein
MTRTLPVVLLLMALGSTTTPAAQPRPPAPPRTPAAPAVPAPGAAFAPLAGEERSADEIRQRLREVLRGYPPSVGQVLRLDPSLMEREGYLATYPALAAFLAQHPEVARMPAYYFGAPEVEQRSDPRAQAVRVFGDVFSFAFVLTGVIAFFLTFAWLARLLVDHRRWQRAMRLQTDVHAKLLDRLTSNAELLTYIQSPAGQNFLQSAPVSIDAAPRPAAGAPIGRILWSVQAGVVLAVVGLGLRFARGEVIEELTGPLNLVAVLAISLGVGFALSAAVAYLMSARLGLLESTKS